MTTKWFKVLVAATALVVSSSAMAGKAHREAEKELKPKAAAAVKAVKAACGCGIKIDLDAASFNKTSNEKAAAYASNIGNEFTNVSDKAKEFCNDAASKKLFCSNVKTVSVISKGTSEADAQHDSHKGLLKIFTSEQMNSGGYKMKEIMDQW